MKLRLERVARGINLQSIMYMCMKKVCLVDALHGKGKGKDNDKVFLLLNEAQRHGDVLGEWRYSSTHF